MNPLKLTFADVMKNASAFLNPGMDPTPLIPKAPRVRLSEEGKLKLRAVIYNQPESETIEVANNVESNNARVKKRGQSNKSVKTQVESVKQFTNCSQPLVLATASDWVASGKVVASAICSFARGSVKDDPIDVYDDSDKDELKVDRKKFCIKKEKVYDVFSLDGLDTPVDTSEFNADEVFNNSVGIFESIDNQSISKSVNQKGWTQVDATISSVSAKNPPDVNVSLRVDSTQQLRKAKRRMEDCFIADYMSKIKPFKREYREDYVGEYTFIVRVGVDENIVEIKDTVTMCKILRVDEVDKENSDASYQPESEAESISDLDEKRRQRNKEFQCFDPENQKTKYNRHPLPKNIPVVDINEKLSETASYSWLGRYEVIRSNTAFNKFLNKFKMGEFAPTIAEFQGVHYRFLRVGTNAKTQPVKQYNQFVIGNNFTIFRLGMNGSPNVDLGINSRVRERRLPQPINKKYTVASLFWANELLKGQKAW